MKIQLRNVTKYTVRDICALEVRSDQNTYVAANAVSIAQAHFEPTAEFRAIYLGETPIGFVQWRTGATPSTVVLWRLMIDRHYQSAGHGRAALTSTLEAMRLQSFKTVETSVVPGQASPLGFYLSQGFQETKQQTPRGEWLLRRLL